MLTKRQYFLTKVAEEANEVATMAMKCIQFGPHERYQNGPTNLERLLTEINDLSINVMLLLGRDDVHLIGEYDHTAKLEKIAKYLEYSQSLGVTKRDEDDPA